MKRTIKIIILFVIVFALFSFNRNVEANSIQNISMDIFVDDNGDAYVTETWNCRTTQGTEVYHPYYNLGNSEIKDLSVYEGNFKYTTLSNWNTSGTLTSKANKCGINKISDGVELCWGIGSYDKHTYTVKYTITNFVSELTDSQMIYWTLIPHDFSNAIGSVYIKIHTNFDIEDTIDVWGYGNYGGTAYVYDGYIEMQSDGSLASNEYMTILVKFPLGRFNTTNKLNKDFNYYFEMAEEGATKYVEESNTTNNSSGLLPFMIIVLSFVTFIIVGVTNSGTHFNFGPEGKKISRDLPYYRDIPCKKDVFRAYYIGYKYGLIKNKSDLLGAIILKWLKDSIIRIEQKETSGIFKKENTVVVLKETDPNIFEDLQEKQLFSMLNTASKDGYLENKEFEKWCERSYSKILEWFDTIIELQELNLIREGLIQVEKKTALKIFTSKHLIVTPALRKEAEELAGLKKYLQDYSLIHERESMEVHIFEEYLVYAQIMGIAKKVAKQFKELYPEIIEQSSFTSYDNIVFVHMCADNGIKSARHAKSVAEARASSYSSGGSGFSSGGGGGGSFGGGGGGGGFR